MQQTNFKTVFHKKSGQQLTMYSVISDYKKEDGTWANWSTFGEDRFQTKSGSTYEHIQARCKIGGYQQAKNPTYIGCTRTVAFSNFQTFTDWYVEQIGYGIEDYDLDKDILVSGNKLYGEDTCVLIPHSLNVFLCDSGKVRGRYPQGVHYFKRDSKFKAQIKLNGTQKHIGLYHTVDEASVAYKNAKEAYARDWYERLKAGEFVVDERVIERMRTYTFTEQNKGN